MQLKPRQHGHPHRPCRLSTYQRVHERRINGFMRRHFVTAETLAFNWIPNTGSLVLAGEIGCIGRIVISVCKRIAVVSNDIPENPLVQTVQYSYSILVRGVGKIYRWDNADHHGFDDPHHLHTFVFPPIDPDDDTGTITWIGELNWPTLSQVIETAIDWHGANLNLLADAHATLAAEELQPFSSVARWYPN